MGLYNNSLRSKGYLFIRNGANITFLILFAHDYHIPDILYGHFLVR